MSPDQGGILPQVCRAGRSVEKNAACHWPMEVIIELCDSITLSHWLICFIQEVAMGLILSVRIVIGEWNSESAQTEREQDWQQGRHGYCWSPSGQHHAWGAGPGQCWPGKQGSTNVVSYSLGLSRCSCRASRFQWPLAQRASVTELFMTCSTVDWTLSQLK